MSIYLNSFGEVTAQKQIMKKAKIYWWKKSINQNCFSSFKLKIKTIIVKIDKLGTINLYIDQKYSKISSNFTYKCVKLFLTMCKNVNFFGFVL